MMYCQPCGYRVNEVPCAVLATFDSRLLGLLRGFELEPYFTGVRFFDLTERGETRRRIFTAALQAHGLKPHKRRVGDSLREDFEGLKALAGTWLLDRASTNLAIVRQLSRLGSIG